MINYKAFYQKYGMIRLEHFRKGRFFSLDKFSLPKESLLHYLPEDNADQGIVPQDKLILLYEQNRFVEHVMELEGDEGKPKEVPTNKQKLIQQYHKRYRRLRLSRRRTTVLRDKNNLLIMNYAPLSQLYRYVRSPMAGFYEWSNINATLWKTITQLTDTGRMQYIEFSLPKTIPEKQWFEKAGKSINKAVLEVFNTPQHLQFLSLYNWLSRKPDVTIPELELSTLVNTTLVFTVGSKFALLNMGELYQWREDNDAQIEKHFLKLLEAMESQRSQVADVEEGSIEADVEGNNFKASDLSATIRQEAESLAEAGVISAAEYRRAIKLGERYKEIKIGDTDLKAFIAKDNKTLEPIKDNYVPDMDVVRDKSLLESRLDRFDSEYLDKVMEKDIAKMVVNLQKSGVAITDYKIDSISDAANRSNVYSVRITPLIGKPTTINFRVPKVNQNGVFMVNGVKSRLNKQRGDLPIRKVKPSRVSLTSYYSKFFVDRNENLSRDYAHWLSKQIITASEDNKGIVSELKIRNVFDHEFRAPRLYSGLGCKINSFKAKGWSYQFDPKQLEKEYPEDILKVARRDDEIPFAKKNGSYLLMDENDQIIEYTKDKKKKYLGSLDTFLGFNGAKAPTEMATVRLLGKNIPVGFILGWRMGLTNAMKRLKVEYRTAPRGTRVQLMEGEFIIKFADESLILNRANKFAMLCFSGLTQYKQSLSKYDFDTFDNQDVYFNVLDEHNMGVRFLRELELMFQLWVDPITLELLEYLEQPTDLEGLLIKAVELLITDDHPRETDTEYMRFKGYERIPGMIYKELVGGVRGYKARPMTPNNGVEVNPRAVWLAIIQDPSVALIEDSNPIHNLKEKERVTYSGAGGRSGETMVRRSREFHPNDKGIISEASPDSGKVGINTHLTANPKLANLRGVVDKYNEKEDGYSRLVSNTALLAPASDRDDPKRTNFTNVQQSHGIAVEGGSVSPLRTGHEEVIAHRVDDLFAFSAKEDGVIENVSEKALTVKYKSGKVDSVELGERWGVVAGTNVKHSIVTDFSQGTKVKAGDILAYNTGFFERSWFNPTQVSWKAGVMVKTAIMDTLDTLEDSSAISERVGKLMTTTVGKVRHIKVPFDHTVHNLVSVGDHVESDSILCTLEDSITGDNKLFDESTAQALNVLSAAAPKAKFAGTVDRIEVMYYGDMSDMSDSLQAIAKQGDRERRKRVKELSLNEAATGELKESIHVDAALLPMDTLVISIYISHPQTAGVGDKGVFGSALKTTFGRVLTGVNETESGETIDAVFGFQSISNRIVTSPMIMGTTNTLLRVLGKHLAELYKEGK
ncbi:hypothetical protein [Endozoicomonas sp. ONNA1]|uniref:hypothetical protein n=1 Tax=Endozoicomonas sp. ONNA1 TaxID=2828740 RepID=UPI002147ED84|nr:hypothetical protein [Endozoicomonas sp. ONNA1]